VNQVADLVEFFGGSPERTAESACFVSDVKTRMWSAVSMMCGILKRLPGLVAFYDAEDQSGALSAARLPVNFRSDLRFVSSIGHVYAATQRLLEGERSNAAAVVVLVMDMKGYLHGDEFIILPVGDSSETQTCSFGDLSELGQTYVQNLRYWNMKRVTLFKCHLAHTPLFRAEHLWKRTIQLKHS
jgi:hypothetical protein